MWNRVARQIRSSVGIISFMVLLVAVVSFAYAFAYDEYYHDKEKSLLFSAELGGCIFLGSLVVSIVAAFVPVFQWWHKQLARKYVSDSDTAQRVLTWFYRAIMIEVVLGLIAGSFFGETFFAGPRALFKWLIEVAKDIFT